MQPLRCLLTFAKLTAGLRWFLVGGGRFTPGHAKVRCEEWPVSLPPQGLRPQAQPLAEGLQEGAGVGAEDLTVSEGLAACSPPRFTLIVPASKCRLISDLCSGRPFVRTPCL